MVKRRSKRGSAKRAPVASAAELARARAIVAPYIEPKPSDAESWRREANLHAAIRKILHLCRITHTVTDASRIFESATGGRPRVDEGWPDLTAIGPGGRAMLIESKSATGNPRPLQWLTLAAAIESDALVYVPRTIVGFSIWLADCYKSHATDRRTSRILSVARALIDGTTTVKFLAPTDREMRP